MVRVPLPLFTAQTAKTISQSTSVSVAIQTASLAVRSQRTNATSGMHGIRAVRLSAKCNTVNSIVGDPQSPHITSSQSRLTPVFTSTRSGKNEGVQFQTGPLVGAQVMSSAIGSECDGGYTKV